MTWGWQGAPADVQPGGDAPAPIVEPVPPALRGIIRLSPSRFARWADYAAPVGILILLLASGSCWWQGLPPWPLVGILPLSLLALSPDRGNLVVAMELRADGCYLQDARHGWFRVRQTGAVYLTPWVISMACRSAPWGRRRTLTIWRDSVSDACFRRCSRLLRHRRWPGATMDPARKPW